ncbi:hypothetical protein ISCGN_031927 [Ixodes scapularis]
MADDDLGGSSKVTVFDTADFIRLYAFQNRWSADAASVLVVNTVCVDRYFAKDSRLLREGCTFKEEACVKKFMVNNFDPDHTVHLTQVRQPALLVFSLATVVQVNTLVQTILHLFRKLTRRPEDVIKRLQARISSYRKAIARLRKQQLKTPQTASQALEIIRPHVSEEMMVLSELPVWMTEPRFSSSLEFLGVTVSSIMTSHRSLRRIFRSLDASEVGRTKRRKEEVRTAAVIHRLRTHSAIIPVRRHNMWWDSDPDCQALHRVSRYRPPSP